MKQHITVEQLMELTEEQQQRLRELWKREFGDVFYITDYKDNKEVQMQVMDRVWQLIVKDYRKEFLPLLSIGQMIELLDNKTNELRKKDYPTEQDDKTDNDIAITLSDIYKTLREGNDLCDVLWQAVKQVL